MYSVRHKAHINEDNNYSNREMRNKSDAIKIRNFLITAAHTLPYRFFSSVPCCLDNIHTRFTASKKKNVNILSISPK